MLDFYKYPELAFFFVTAKQGTKKLNFPVFYLCVPCNCRCCSCPLL